MGKSIIGCSKHFLILILIALPIIHFLITPNFSKSRPNIYAGRIGCNMAINEATSAIEMYNMDYKELMKELNKDNIDILKNKTINKEGKKYLNEKWPYIKEGWESREKCEYRSQGDLSDDGLIYCVYHGSHPRLIESKIPPSKEFLKDEREKSIKKFFKDYGVLIGLMFFIILLIIL